MVRIQHENVMTKEAYENARSAGIIYTHIAQTLARDYTDLFYVNLDSEEYIEYRIDNEGSMLSEMQRGWHFFSDCREDLAQKVYSEDREAFLNATNRRGLMKALSRKDTFVMTYRQEGDHGPTYVSMKATRIAADNDHIILGVSNVNTQVRDHMDAERAAQLRETRRAIDFYDAVVHTGNEALDTLLTEKSVYCANRAIRLSCTVTSARLGRIELVDLYTLLGNAIDNAIESAEKLSDSERKVISLNVSDRGQMLHIQIENYYGGTLALSDGLPVTTKADRANHGYGVKSIRAIAQKYGGQLMIGMENQVFSLQILIPT
jgi:hypothetical protein